MLRGRTTGVVLGAVLALGGLASCGSEPEEVVERSAPSPTSAEAELPVQADTGTEAPIADIDQYVAMADVIAVGVFTDIEEAVTRDGPDPDDPSGSTTEHGALTLRVDEVIKGDVETGTTVSIRAGGRILDRDGEPISELGPYVTGLEDWGSLVGGEHLVFLTRVDDAWAISSSQGVLVVEDEVVSRLPQPEGPGAPGYTQVLDGLPLDDARRLLAG